MATLLLEAARALRLAARFASGYLDGVASRAGQAVTHAWAEVYFPEHGWFGCDPSLGEGTSEKHIVCGVSSHPRGVMPVSGYYSGSRRSYLAMDVNVDIKPLETPDPASSETQQSPVCELQGKPRKYEAYQFPSSAAPLDFCASFALPDRLYNCDAGDGTHHNSHTTETRSSMIVPAASTTVERTVY
jgi:hypothetical protein